MFELCSVVAVPVFVYGSETWLMKIKTGREYWQLVSNIGDLWGACREIGRIKSGVRRTELGILHWIENEMKIETKEE
jgi:hypothetical protein